MNSGGIRPDFANQGTMLWEIGRVFQRMNSMIFFGVIFDADYEAGKIRVRSGEEGEEDALETDWIPWMTMRAGNNRTWIAPEKGEQVLILAQNGNLTNAVALLGLPYTDFPHEAKDADMEKEVWVDHEKAFLEFNRKTWFRRFFINEAGTFSWNIGEQASITMDKEHIELRVEDTKFVLKDGRISLHVNDKESSLLLTPDTLTAFVRETGIMELTKDKFEASISKEGVLTVLKDLVQAAVKDNGVLRVQEKSVSAELIAEQVRVVLTPETIKAAVKQALLEIAAEQATLLVPGSSLKLEAAGVTMVSPKFDGIQGNAAPGQYPAGDVTAATPPPVTQMPPSKELPAHATGNQPYHPVRGREP